MLGQDSSSFGLLLWIVLPLDVAMPSRLLLGKGNEGVFAGYAIGFLCIR